MQMYCLWLKEFWRFIVMPRFSRPSFLCSPLPPSDTLQSEWLCQDGFARIILAPLGGQVLHSAIHFHFKRHGGTIWLLCDELVDQDWVHFNETLYVHCSEAELIHEKAGHGQSPIWVIWSDLKKFTCPRIWNSHHWREASCNALCKFPTCSPKKHIVQLCSRHFLCLQRPFALWHMTFFSCLAVSVRVGSPLLPASHGHWSSLGQSLCVSLLLSFTSD